MMLGTLARIGLALWGAFLIAYAGIELLDPGFLQSEPRDTSRLEVLPGALCIAAIGVFLVLPSSMLSTGRRRYLGGLVVGSVVSLAFIAPGALGHPFRWQNILFATLFYAVPCLARFLLQSGDQGPVSRSPQEGRLA